VGRFTADRYLFGKPVAAQQKQRRFGLPAKDADTGPADLYGDVYPHLYRHGDDG